jgi:transcriptional regulator with XRE-family HTH domain
MTDRIDGSAVRTLRKRLGLTQAQLAQKSGVSADSISGIERGTQSGKANATRERLARALQVSQDVIAGAAPIPGGGAVEDEREGFLYRLNARVDGAVRNAYTLASLRYGVPQIRMIELAPLLFVLAAERSLRMRREQLDKLESALSDVSASASELHHLPAVADPSWDADPAISSERASISEADIFAEHLDDQLYWRRGSIKSDYNMEVDNPFVRNLRSEANDIETAQVSVISKSDVSYHVCLAEARRIANGDPALAMGILVGWAPLHEMPRELMADDAIDARVAWLRQKRIEHDAREQELLADLGFDVTREENADDQI